MPLTRKQIETYKAKCKKAGRDPIITTKRIFKEGYSKGKFTKPINRFRTKGIYSSRSGKSSWQVVKRTDHTVWLVKLDDMNWDPIGEVNQVKIREDFTYECEYTFTKSPKAWIKSTDKKTERN